MCFWLRIYNFVVVLVFDLCCLAILLMAVILFVELFENEIQRLNLNRNRRFLRERSDPLSLPEKTFKGIYRVSRELGHWLLGQIGPHMREGERSTSLPKSLRLFAALHFISHGSYQNSVGQDYLTSMHQTSISRCLSEVTDLIIDVLGHFIKFPETEDEKNQQKILFTENGAFPGIIGCIDCTQVAIISPKTDDPEMPGVIFYCRKQYYSLNVQIVCNAELKIININARFPGSVHDSAIWQTSLVQRHLANNFRNNRNQLTYLLGDSGYPLEPWLLTPVAHPGNDNEREYNRAHRAIRNVVERTNGVLKQRFRCLFKHRTLHYAPARAAQIIYSCAIMHNLCILRNENVDDYGDNLNDNDEDAEYEVEDNNPIRRHVLQEGRIVRNRVIQNYFYM